MVSNGNDSVKHLVDEQEISRQEMDSSFAVKDNSNNSSESFLFLESSHLDPLMIPLDCLLSPPILLLILLLMSCVVTTTTIALCLSTKVKQLRELLVKERDHSVLHSNSFGVLLEDNFLSQQLSSTGSGSSASAFHSGGPFYPSPTSTLASLGGRAMFSGSGHNKTRMNVFK